MVVGIVGWQGAGTIDCALLLGIMHSAAMMITIFFSIFYEHFYIHVCLKKSKNNKHPGSASKRFLESPRNVHLFLM